MKVLRGEIKAAEDQTQMPHPHVERERENQDGHGDQDHLKDTVGQEVNHVTVMMKQKETTEAEERKLWEVSLFLVRT